jgi:YwiC-like protein
VADLDTAPRRRPAPGARRRTWLPPQHGAWPMLVVPYLAGLLTTGYRWPDVPLLGAWLAGYLLSYFALLAVKSRRPARYRAQLLGYAAVAVPLGAVVVLARPRVLWFAAAFGVLLAVNAWYALRRRDRALANGVASVVQSCLLVLVVATVAGRPTGAAVGAFVLCLAYFTGTVFYVKTMIRERDNPAYRWWSVGYHALAVPVATLVSPWAGGLFLWLLVRAWLLPGRRLAPLRVGLLEMVHCVLLLVCVAALA